MQTGVIAAGHPQTAEAGAAILRRGGNAVDAAVAAAFASFVAESALVNIGGGGIAQVYDAGRGQAVVYDFFSNMPGLPANGAIPPPDIDFRQVLVDFGAAQQPFYIGRGSVAVPGVVAGLARMVEERGTLPLAAVLAPTIRLAREGVPLSVTQAYVADLLHPILTDTPAIAALYAPNGSFVTVGERLYFTALADTLEQLGRQGASLFYTGPVAQKILIDQRAYHGLLTETDLAAYRVLACDPIVVPYRDYTILLPPPSSDGGPLLAFALNLLADQSLARNPHNGAAHLQILTEVMRLTNIARAEWEAEEIKSAAAPQTAKAVDRLLNQAMLKKYRRKLIDALAGRAIIHDAAARPGPAHTTHISVADGTGMLVSITTSAGENAGFVVGDTGVTLNNMLGEIDLHPNGFHKLPPGRRLATMMSPAIVLHRGRPILAVGSGGSNRLRSAILQVISNVIDFGLSLTEAVEAPRIHYEDNVTQLEGGIAAGVADHLAAAGYTVNRWPAPNMFFGGAHAVARQNVADDHALWTAVGDPRRGGSVALV